MTDRELTNRISQVFDNFEDPDAEYGWQELRKKYPENRRKPLVLWWGGAAAVLLVVCGLWLMTDIREGDKELAKAEPGSLINKDNSIREPENALKNKVSPDSPSSHLSGNPANLSGARSSEYVNPGSPVPSRSTSDIKASIASAGAINTAPMYVLDSVEIKTLRVENTIQKLPVISLPRQVNSASIYNPETRDSLISATAKMLALAQKDPGADSHAHLVEKVSYSSKKSRARNNAFSFYAGSYFNYSVGSETKLNFGAGFTSDIKVTDNLKLSTGLALTNNSLTYNNGVPRSDKQDLAFDAVPSFAGGGNNNLTTITKYDASLLALDIPINIKYMVIPQDNKLYLLAGLSSGTYLSETYSVNYRNYSSAGLYLNQTQSNALKKQLQAFDFARILNISFGYSANFGKNRNITIEPFLKYPLSGLGSEDLVFGSSGVNLKLNFSKFKK